MEELACTTVSPIHPLIHLSAPRGLRFRVLERVTIRGSGSVGGEKCWEKKREKVFFFSFFPPRRSPPSRIYAYYSISPAVVQRSYYMTMCIHIYVYVLYTIQNAIWSCRCTTHRTIRNYLNSFTLMTLERAIEGERKNTKTELTLTQKKNR